MLKFKNYCISCIVDHNLVHIKFNYILTCTCIAYIYLQCKPKSNKKMINKYSKVKGTIASVPFNMACIIQSYECVLHFITIAWIP